MRLFFSSIFAAVMLLTVAQPALAQTNVAANTNSACDKLRSQFQNYGGADIVGSLPSYCNPTSIYTKIINVAYVLIVIAAVLAIMYGGYLYMTARANAEQAKKARTILTWAIIGLAIALLATLIVNVVVRFIVENR